MKLHLGIIEVDHQSDQTLLVNFNDGTYAFFSVFQLAALQPQRLVGDGENAEVGQVASPIALSTADAGS